MVLLATLFLVVAGIYSIKQTPIDAIPDLSEVQVIVKTSYPGQAPQVVEDQVTYPLTSTLLSVPKAKTVRGFSFFGDSYVYVIFEEGTDLYWARARVQEYLGQVASKLPGTASSQLGPDATGVGWAFIYAWQDRTGQHDLSQLRSIQDWFLKYELQTVAGVSEVAAVGGMVKQYQVQVDPQKLRAYGIPLALLQTAIEQGNQEVGASVIEMAEAEYMVRATGYIQNEQDLGNIPLGVNQNGTPLLLKDVAEIGTGPQMRRGIAELNGEGETVGGIVVMRFGENAQQVINGVKEKLEQLRVKVGTAPQSFVLAQAILESGWGTSRFARDYNNYFGLHCYKDGCGAKPEKADVYMEIFETPGDSILGYYERLNTGSAFANFREVRYQTQDSSNRLDKLLNTLGSYSELGLTEYKKRLMDVINHNDLTQYDKPVCSKD